jgi:hypothetical protein
MSAMRAKKTVLAGLLVSFTFAGCLIVPQPRDEGMTEGTASSADRGA